MKEVKILNINDLDEVYGLSRPPTLGELKAIGFSAIESLSLKTMDLLASAVRETPPGGSPYPSEIAAISRLSE